MATSATIAEAQSSSQFETIMLENLEKWGVKFNWRQHVRLWVSLVCVMLSVAFLHYAPWFLIPIGWLALGSAMFGCSGVVASCALDTFSKNAWLNSCIGTILGMPLLLSFGPLRATMKTASTTVRNVADSSLWLVTGFFAFHKANFRTWSSKVFVANNIFLYAFVAGFLTLIYSLGGYQALGKYYLAPLVVYYIWHSVSIKVGRSLEVTIKEDEHLAKLIRAIKLRYEDKGVSIPNVARIFAKALDFMEDGLGSKAFRTIFGWEQLVPADIAYHSMQQFKEKMVDVADLKKKAAAQASLHNVTEEIEVINTIAQPSSPSWDSYYFDWTKTSKLLAIHMAGFYGFYLLFTSYDIHTYTKIFMVLQYHFCGWGITGGYHRLWAHKSWDAPMWVQWIFAFFGAGTGEGSILWWSRDHRMHHKFGDTDKDPYPIVHGFWWAHIGWLMFTKNKTCLSAGKKLEDEGAFDDLKSLRLVQIQHKYYGLFFLSASYLFPILICSLWGESILNASFVAGAIPLVFSFQSTMCVNSLAHCWGEKPYNPKISAVQNVIVAIITGGEGWHNFHHAFPMDFRCSDKWYQFNTTKWMIQGLAKLGLARNLRIHQRRTDEKHSE